MEDGWLLAQVLEFHLKRQRIDTNHALHDAVGLFDKIRSPYYHKLYEVLDAQPQKDQKVDYAAWSPTPGGPLNWIYQHDIGEEWKDIRAALQLTADGTTSKG